jgi:luciferase-type oxidoreductase
MSTKALAQKMVQPIDSKPIDDESIDNRGFQTINRGYNGVFRSNRLSLGLVVPIETYAQGPVPTMTHHLERIQLAEALGFTAVWLRDVPFNVPSFGDAGQTYDPFVYLGLLAAQTERIALGVASIILPLRHPAHVAKAAATVDVLARGRLILGVASGDRPEEYPALNVPFPERGERFRASFRYIRQMGVRQMGVRQMHSRQMGKNPPAFQNPYGSPNGTMDMLPKPTTSKLPLLVTGSSQQAPEWIAQNGDGWMTYPRKTELQATIIQDWQARVAATGQPPKPVMQPLYIDLTPNPETRAQPIHLGFRLGTRSLLDHLQTLEGIGINHVALNLRFNQTDVETTLKRLADEILPHFV